MISKLHQRLGTAGFIIAIVALVAALSGGAYAASGTLTGKQKKEVKKIAQKEAKKYAGKPGAPGAPGAKGDTGANGTAGGNGTNGKSVVLVNQSPGGCNEGGFTYEVEGSGRQNEVCNGEEGPPGQTGFTATLPSNKTETGTWAATFNHEGSAPISFPIPLAAELDPAHVKVIPASGAVPTECENPAHAGTASAANPEATPGYLCVYTTFFENSGAVSLVFKSSEVQEGAGVTGAILILNSAAADTGWGSFAVTAP